MARHLIYESFHFHFYGQRRSSITARSSRVSTHHLSVDWRMTVVHSRLNDNLNTNFALSEMDSRVRCGDWESRNLGHLAEESADRSRCE
jgi:hypothetical protein